MADRDTIPVLAPGNQQMKVQLYGLECPEKYIRHEGSRFKALMLAGKKAMMRESVGRPRHSLSVGVV